MYNVVKSGEIVITGEQILVFNDDKIQAFVRQAGGENVLGQWRR